MSKTSSELQQLSSYTTIVADTGDIDEIARVKPTDATTNPSLILKAATSEKYHHFIREAQRIPEPARMRIDRVLTSMGCAILDVIPGRVSTEVDARLSFNTRATVEKARRIISLYEAAGIPRERVLIKIAATWEGCMAARVLELEGIHCNMTLIFSLEQAEASAQAKASLISPFVGRIYDWYKASEGPAWDEKSMAGVNDPGVQSVTAIFRRLKSAGSSTQIMGASFRNTGEILALAGCDLLTISPKFLDLLSKQDSFVPRRLDPATLTPTDPISIEECDFRYALNQSRVATDKLSEGIRAFVADTEKLEGLLH